MAETRLPLEIHTDNGSTFKGAKNYISKKFLANLGKVLKKKVHAPKKDKNFEEKLQILMGDIRKLDPIKYAQYEKYANIKWKFIPPYSPWVGGLWEASVKSIKRYLLPMIASSYKTATEIQSAMIQCTSILNNRPLCSYESENGEAILSPADLWKGQLNESLGLRVFDEDAKISESDRMQHRQECLKILANYFRRDYLLAIRDRTPRAYGQREFPVGSLVVVRVETESPMNWPKGVIMKEHKGTTNNVTRVLDVKLSNGTIRKVTSDHVALIPRNDNLKTEPTSIQAPQAKVIPFIQTNNNGNKGTVNPNPVIQTCLTQIKKTGYV